jgi:hypothetical protein
MENIYWTGFQFQHYDSNLKCSFNRFLSSMMLELFRQRGILCFVLTAWYSLFCSDSVVFFVLFRQRGILCFVPTAWYSWNKTKNTTLSEQNKEYHAVRTKQRIPHCLNKTKNTTLSEQNKEYHAVRTKQRIPRCRNKTKNTTILCFVLIAWYSLFCSDSVVFFVLFRQRGILCFVLTAWYSGTKQRIPRC